jgi:plastocyanin
MILYEMLLTADKFGILFAIAITAIAVSFSTTSGLTIESSMPTGNDMSVKSISELELEIRLAQKASDDIQKLAKEIEEKTEKTQKLAKETVGAKLPAKFVSIPRGTSSPGCEKANLCYDPPNVTIFVGGEIIWRNDDFSPHTVTSGIAITGPDDIFNSGLIKAEQTFSYRFDSSGEFKYFCMIHPWATGKVTVS